MEQDGKIAAYLEAGPGKDFFVEVKIENGNCRKKYIPTPMELENCMFDSISNGYITFFEGKGEDLKEAYESAKRKFLSDDIPSINMDEVEDRKISFKPDKWMYLLAKGRTYKVKFKEEDIYGCTICGLRGKHLCHKVDCDKGLFVLQGEVR